MRILIVEDDEDLLALLKKSLISEGYAVDTCTDGEEGSWFLEQNAYDAAVLDRMLPLKNGVELLKQARKKGILTPVLMLTALDGINDRVEGLDAGADDYLGKPFDTRELLARLRALVRRPTQIETSQIVCAGDLQLDLQQFVLKGPNGQENLSKKEAALLEQLMRAFDQTLSREVLFVRVWGPGTDVEQANLDSYTYFVRRRIKAVQSQCELVTVRAVGYRLEMKPC